MKKPKPPLRNYQQMIRIMQDKSNGKFKQHGHYSMGTAFGTERAQGVDLVIRTLEELGLPSTSIRKPAAQDEGGKLSTRLSSNYFFQLDASSQAFFKGLGAPRVRSRNDLIPGTKLRRDLGKHAFSKKVEPTINLSPMESHSGKKQNDDAKGNKKGV